MIIINFIKECFHYRLSIYYAEKFKKIKTDRKKAIAYRRKAIDHMELYDKYSKLVTNKMYGDNKK